MLNALFNYHNFLDAALTSLDRISNSLQCSSMLIYSAAQYLWDVICQVHMRIIKSHSGPKVTCVGLLLGWSIISLQSWGQLLCTQITVYSNRTQPLASVLSCLSPCRQTTLQPADPHSVLIFILPKLSLPGTICTKFISLAALKPIFCISLHCQLDWDIPKMKD